VPGQKASEGGLLMSMAKEYKAINETRTSTNWFSFEVNRMRCVKGEQ
jgi:hypothetical protein